MAATPADTVKNRFLDLTATKKQSKEARRALFSKPRLSRPSEMRRPGKSKAERTATGMYRSQAKNRGESLNLDKITRGSILGR